MVLQLNSEPPAKMLGLLLIGVNVVTTVLCQVVELLYSYTEWFPWYISKNSDSLRCIVPADKL
jgi:hypothetical protein